MVDAFLIGTAGRGSRSTAATASGLYSQPPTAGNLLIAVVKGSSTTSQSTAFSQAAGTTGWTQALAVGNSATFFARVEVWTKTAAGNDAVPSFNVMTGATRAAEVTCYEVFNPNASPIDVSGTKASGASSVAISSASIAVATSGNVAASGEIGISAFAGLIPAAPATNTWARAAGWSVQIWNDASTSSNSHFADEYAWAPASGAVLNWAPTITTYTGYAASLTFVIKPGSATYPLNQVSPVHRLCTGNANSVVSFGISPHGIQQIGSLLVFGVKLTTSTITLSSITDSLGITTGWTRVAGPFVDNNATPRSHEIWIGKSTGIGVTNLNLTWSASNAGLMTDCDFQEFTTGYTWSQWTRRGTQQAGQNNASSSTHSWASLTAVAGDTFYGLVRAIAGGPEFRTTGLGMACTWTSAGNCTMYEIGAIAGASARSCLDGSTVLSYTLGVLLDYVNVWPLDGSASAVSSASGTPGIYTPLIGSSANASSADGAVVTSAVISGSAPAVSGASGAVVLRASVTGSSAASSAAYGTISSLGVISGASATVSAASGAVGTRLAISGASAATSAANGAAVLNAVITGSSITGSSASGSITTKGVLSGSSLNSSGAFASIATVYGISGAATSATFASGALYLQGIVAGASTATSAANGTLGKVAPLAGSAPALSSASGAVTVVLGAQVYQISGSSASASNAAGAIGLLASVVGSAATASAASGTVVLNGVISGSAPAASHANGTIGSAPPADALAASVSSASGKVVLEEVCSGSSSTPSTAFGTVTASLAIAGSATARSAASGSLGGSAFLVGSAAAASAADGAVTSTLAIAGASLSASTAAGTVAGTLALAGTAAASSSAAGTIGGLAALAGSASSASLAAGWLVGVLEIEGLSIAVSGGDGTVLPPFIAGLLPPEVTGIVTVDPAPAVRVTVEDTAAVVLVSSVAAGITVSEAEGTVFISNAVHAEVKG